MDHSNSVVFCLLTFLATAYAYIEVTSIEGPRSVALNGDKDIVLDCKYKTDESGLTFLKWFYNDHPIYQWVVGSDHVSLLGVLKDHIDPTYQATNDSSTMYRALRLIDVTPAISGIYRCKVEANFVEDSSAIKLTIYEPAIDGLHLELMHEDSIAICQAGGIYPKPTVTLKILGENDTISIPYDIENNVTLDNDNNYYNVTSILRFQRPNTTEGIRVTCELFIQGTDYFLNETQDYVTDGSGALKYSFSLVTVLPLIVAFILKY